MIGITSPTLAVRYNTPSYWTAGRAAIMAAVYPDGALTSLVDVVEPEWAGISLPSGCASITRYTVTEPGGRSGGSGAYVHRLNPTAAALEKCVIFCAGHVTAWNVEYCSSTDGNIIPALLAAGYHVLAVDLPNFGLQPLQAVVINGSLRTMGGKNLYHQPDQLAGPWSGPSLVRLYTDHIIRAMNQITEDLGISIFGLLGHSGGASTAAMVACTDVRPSVVHFIQSTGYVTTPASGVQYEYETWSGNDVQTAVHGNANEQKAFAMAVPGRRTVQHFADADEFSGDQHLLWQQWVEQLTTWIGNAAAGTNVAGYRKTTGAHNIDATQTAWIVAHLQAHL